MRQITSCLRAKQLHFAPNNFIFAPKNIIFCAKFKFTPAPEEKILLGVKPKVAPEEKKSAWNKTKSCVGDFQEKWGKTQTGL